MSKAAEEENGVAAASSGGEEEGDSWPEAETQGGQERRICEAQGRQEGPATAPPATATTTTTTTATTATIRCRRQVHSVENPRPCSLRLARQP